MTHAIYARISEDSDGLEAGVDRQVEDASKLAGRPIADELVFIDNDISASTRSKKLRPRWDALLELIEAGAVKNVWAYSSSRLTRRPAELELLISLTERTGVTFHTATGAINLATADGRMLARMLASVDAAEAERIGERVARQKLGRAEAGLPQGGRARLYGFTREWSKVDAEAEVIEEVFKRRAEGESVTGIANDLAGRGLTTADFVCKYHSGRWPSDKVRPADVPETEAECRETDRAGRCKPGVPWRHQSLVKTLSNPTYAGLREYKGEVVGKMRDGFPEIVSEELFNAAQLVKAEGAAPGTNTRRYLLSGIARCADCGERMKGAPSSRRVARYRCAATYGGCGKTSIRCDWIDYEIEIEAFTAEIVAKGAPEEPSGALTSEAAEIRAELRTLQDAVNARELSMATALPMLRNLEDRLREAEAAAAKATVKAASGSWEIKEFSDLLNLPLSARRAVIVRHVAAVVISKGETTGRNIKDLERVEVHFKDGTVKSLSNEVPAAS